MFSIDAACHAHSLCELAEGPVWDRERGELLWLDIKGCRVWHVDGSGEPEVLCEMAQNIGCMALREGGGMILGLAAGLYLTGPGGEFQRLEAPELSPRVRFNDGKCDAEGRFWAGTINLFPGESGLARLYCVMPDRSVHCVLDGVTNSNGLAFSADGRTLYYIDTPTRRVDAFDILNEPDGVPELKNRRTVVRIEEEDVWPDGMTIDAEGRLWIALWGTGKVGCYDPATGAPLGEVRAPVRAVSSCCFGGDDLRTLYVTTAREGMLPGEANLAGDVYRARLPVSGAPSHRFRG